MKTEMSTFDVLAVVRDMRMLVGGYVDKIFQWNRKSILLRINVPGAGKKELIFQDLKWLYISGEKPEMPDAPTQFVVHLRKHLSNGRIVSIFQKDFDRIVVIEVQKEKTFQIVFEIFGEGNLIVASDGKIINCVVSRRWKYRDVRPGAEYSFPPSRFNPIVADREDFARALRASSSDSVRTLATSINLGGQYAEEVCLRAGVDKTMKVKQLKSEEIERLHKAMREIIDSVSDAPRPCIVARAGVPEDVTPLPLVQYSDETLQTYATISEALDDFLRNQKAEDERKESEESRRLKRQLERQKETMVQLKEEIEDSSRKAETIYTNYGAIDDILSKMREGSESSTWDDIKEIGLGLAGVKEVDPATHRLIVEVNKELIRLDYSKGIEENADDIYKRTKELRSKLEGAVRAVKETETRIKKEEKVVATETTGTKPRKTKEFWFESYKWFFTSGGKLVIAGRDARTNDKVVKKHMAQTDRFVHADVHGAPSVVMKDGSTATEQEIREACVFALSHSKAWNAGVVEGSSYWVLPDQVSKTPEPGEFVPRGAFIIRGRRNYEYHVPVELAVGEVQHQGERKIMCGPRSSIEPVSTKFVVLVPGRMDRNKTSALLSRAFNVPEEEISRILPPGDVEIKENMGVRLEE